MENRNLENISNKLTRIHSMLNVIKLNQNAMMDGISLLLEREANMQRHYVMDYLGQNSRLRDRYRNRTSMHPFHRQLFDTYNVLDSPLRHTIPERNTHEERPTQQTTQPATIEFSFMNPSSDTNLQNIFNTIMNDMQNNSSQSSRLTFEQILQYTEITNIREQNSNSNETIMCSICRNNIQDNEPLRKIRNCGHYFHLNCIDNWLLNNSTCPLCRCDIRSNTNTNENTLQSSEL